MGDIITILVSMNDTANLKDQTTNSRTSGATGSLQNFFGMENLLPKTISDPSKLLNVGSTNTQGGNGQIQRSEIVTLRLAGVVTQVLPNANLVVAARQEFRVNNAARAAGYGCDPPTGHRIRQHRAARSPGGGTDHLWRPR